MASRHVRIAIITGATSGIGEATVADISSAALPSWATHAMRKNAGRGLGGSVKDANLPGFDEMLKQQ